MAAPTDDKKEHPSTYFVQDRSNEQELRRLQIQDQMLTRSMGGVLPEQSNPTIFKSVLDVGCGTGSWLIETAKTFPYISELIGVDISAKIVHYARSQAEAEGVADRVHFEVMDALRMLEFPDNSFDLVNQRLGVSFLRIWDWRKLLDEYQRVCLTGGVIRITESDFAHSAYDNSPAFTELVNLCLRAMVQAGHLATPQMDATINMLPSLLIRRGIQQVRTHLHVLRYPAGTPEGEQFAEDMKYGTRTIGPFLRKWTRLPENYEELNQQAIVEMQQPDFVGEWRFLTAWGSNPSYESSRSR